MHNQTFLRGRIRPHIRHKKHNYVSQAHKGYRNEYMVLPPSFLKAEHADALIGSLHGFNHVLFTSSQTDLQSRLSYEYPAMQIHFVSGEQFFTRSEDRPDDSQLLDLLESDSNGFHISLSQYEPRFDTTLTHGGNVLRREIDKLTTDQEIARYPQRIAVCGLHLIGVLWMRSIFRSQQKACVPGQEHAFRSLIEIVEAHVLENGLLRISTTAHIHPRHGTRFIVSDAEMPR
jgi:hypothetical protein